MDQQEQKRPPIGKLKKRPILRTYASIVQEGIGKLKELDDCLELKLSEWTDIMGEERTVTKFAVYIGTIVYNYKKKTGHIGFTTKIIDDETVGVWIKQ